MGNKGIFLLLSFLAVSTMVATGIAVSFRNPFLVVVFLFVLAAIMTTGFRIKKKRERH